MIVEKRRHIAKTVSYRVISTAIGFATMWAVTGSIKFGAAYWSSRVTLEANSILHSRTYLVQMD